jgi:hypothetical protein
VGTAVKKNYVRKINHKEASPRGDGSEKKLCPKNKSQRGVPAWGRQQKKTMSEKKITNRRPRVGTAEMRKIPTQIQPKYKFYTK